MAKLLFGVGVLEGEIASDSSRLCTQMVRFNALKVAMAFRFRGFS